MGALNAALKRRSSTVLLRSRAGGLQDRGPGQRQRTRASAPQEQGAGPPLWGVYSQVMSTLVDFTLSQMHGKVE